MELEHVIYHLAPADYYHGLPEDQPYRWGARAMMLVILVLLLVMIRVAWKRRAKRSGLQSES